MASTVCTKCGCKLKLLFYSSYCAYCSDNTDLFYHAYVVWTKDNDPFWGVQEHPIFKTAESAKEWVGFQFPYDSFEVRDVLCDKPFTWKNLKGTPFLVADTYYKVVYKYPLSDTTKPSVVVLPSNVLLPDNEVIKLNDQTRSSLGLNW